MVPPMVNFSGVLTDLNGKPLTGKVGSTFSIYKDSEGGAPLWIETQNVQADKSGHYTVMLGSTSSQGLPTNIFVSGEARWLGVQAQGQAEQPRVLLMSVPYALKALDAETIGGKPASAFVTASGPTGGSSESTSSNNILPALTGTGTPNHITKWITTTKIGNSGIFETAAGKVGIGTTTPAANLDVKGTEDVRNTLTLFPSGSSPALSLSGTAFSVSNTGKVTFVSGQNFPGTGTVTQVNSGAGLTGGPITGSGTLSVPNSGITNAMLQNSSLTVTANSPLSGGGAVSLGGSTSLGLKSCSSNQILEFTGGAWTCVNAPTGTVSDVAAGTDIIVNNPNGPTVTVNVDTTKVPQLAAANTFTNNQTVSVTSSSPALDAENASNGYAIQAGSANGNGILGSSGLDSNFAAGILGSEYGTTTYTTGVYGYTSSGNGMGVYGQNVSGSSVLFLPPYAGVWGDSSDGEGVLATSDNYFAFQGINNTDGYATMFLRNYTTDTTFGTLLTAFDAAGNGGTGGVCTIDVNGNVSCSGYFYGGILVDGGSRRVALPAIQASENWFEDAGSGQLTKGSAVVNLDPTFVQTVNTEMEYHVFLTPKGDCEGLYVSNQTPRGFEVHELRHGNSDIAFDYRIMAKSRGHENLRLSDVTLRFKMPPAQKAAPKSEPIHVPAPKRPEINSASVIRRVAQGRSAEVK
jgi:hypothetical protein